MNIISNFLDQLGVGEPVTSGSLFMFPLFASATEVACPLTFDEAMALGVVTIGETSLAGSVPELALENRSMQPVFLLDGEQVIGLKQNRAFNLSILVEPHSRAVVPVSCLEAGRWSHEVTSPSSAEHVHFASGRASKVRAVSESLRRDGTYQSDQIQVWRDIERKFAARKERSQTNAESDFYSTRKAQLDEVTSRIPAHPEQTGAIFGIGDRIVGLDVFLGPKLYSDLHEKLLKSYLLEAIEREQAASPPSRDFAFLKIKRLFGGRPVRAPAPGAGEALRWISAEGGAGALVYEDRCIHAVAFCITGAASGTDVDLAVA